MTVDAGGSWPRPEAVAATEVDGLLWEMSSDLLELRRQLAELQLILEDRERQLLEARQGREGSRRAVSTLNAVLTEMVLKGRSELQEARDEATQSMTRRLAAARAEADLLVADATAALTTAMGGPDGVPFAPPPPRDGRADPGRADSGLNTTAPPPPADAPRQPPDDSWAGGRGVTRANAETHRAAVNGWSGPPTSVQTLDHDLNEQFRRVVGLAPNTEFRTPPRGVPAVPAVPPADEIVPSPPPPVVPPSPPPDQADEAFGEFWLNPGGGSAAVSPPSSSRGLPSSPATSAGRPHSGLLDAVLPLIAVMLVIIVALSWLG